MANFRDTGCCSLKDGLSDAFTGRDTGLPDYNTLRRYHGLPKLTQFRDINPQLYEIHPELFDEVSIFQLFPVATVNMCEELKPQTSKL